MAAADGIMSPCAASARLDINGSYYGLYVVEEDAGRIVEQFLPGNADGDLWKGGWSPETNKLTAIAPQAAFWAATIWRPSPPSSTSSSLD